MDTSPRWISVVLRPLVTFCLLATMLVPVVGPAQASTDGSCVMWGALVPSWGEDVRELEALEAAVGEQADLFGFYQGWASEEPFDHLRAKSAIDRGGIPVVAWEPYDWTKGVDQPQFALERIIAGDFDGYVRSWARDIKRFGGPVLLRFAYEMNGNWNPWSEGVNGNEPGEYVKAWRHVHSIFRQEGVRNVRWVWAPNVVTSGSPPLGPLYPGDKYVDVVGMSGYNWGTTKELWPGHWSTWQSFDEIFQGTVGEIRTLTKRPIIISETASTEVGGNKATWIANTLKRLAEQHEIIGFTWFNFDKETDWRVQSSSASVKAFADGLKRARIGCNHRLGLADFAPPSDRFVDDDGSIFENDIEKIAAAGVTKGCNPPTNDRFCPGSHVTRGQMAAFLRRALGLPNSPRDYFRDDNGTTFEGDLNALAHAGVARGCNPPVNDRFCPGGKVTRGQMAAFLSRALGYPNSSKNYFRDDQGSIFETDINAIAAAGVTKGCNPPTNDRFCPGDHVTRGQMAAFLARALGL